MPLSLDDLELVRADPQHDTSRFDCSDDDLNDFVRTDCFNYQKHYLSHTRLAKYRGEIIAFVTLLADSIILETREKESWLPFHKKIVYFPALKIGRIAVHKDYQRQGVGDALMIYCLGIAVRINEELNVGCRFITADAYEMSVSWYEKQGFVFNEHKKGKKHPSMRLDILEDRNTKPTVSGSL
jgi:GNAT superfamily N-acetyltransferase